MKTKEKHASDSSEQRESEEIIKNYLLENAQLLLNEPNCKDFSAEKSIEFEGVTFEFDFHNKEHRIYGEVYSGIDEVKAGQVKKVLTDCFKLVSYEMLIKEQINKFMVFADERVCKKFTGKAWYAKAIESFGIKLVVVDTKEQKEKLQDAKKRQKMENIIEKKN